MFGVLYNQGNALLYPFFVRYVLEEEGGLSLFLGNQSRRIIYHLSKKHPRKKQANRPTKSPRNPQVESSKTCPFNFEMESSTRNRFKLRLLGLYILLGGFFVPFWAMASKRFDKRHTLAIATSIQCLGADLKVVFVLERNDLCQIYHVGATTSLKTKW